jgi:alpha-1,6-mannosyltransferase
VVAPHRRRGGIADRGVIVGDAAQPLPVVTDWGPHGAQIVGFFILAVAALGVAYWRVLPHPARFSLAGIAALATAALAVAWCMPFLFSSDVYAYAAYGELARLGLNPYAHGGFHIGNALLADAAWQWSGAFPICVYGLGFVELARLDVSALAPFGTLAQLQGLRVMASAALLACIPLAWAAYAGDRATRLRAAATIALNPVAIWCAAEGHNDAIALAMVLAGFALVRRRLAGSGAAIVALSALIKPTGAAAAVALAFVDRRARIGACCGIAAAVAFSLPLVAGVTTQLAPHGRYAPQASLQAIFAPLGLIAALLAAGSIAALLAVRGVALLRADRREGWIWLGLAAWVLVPNPYPWYALWLLALVPLSPGSRAATTGLLLSFTSLLRYVPDAVGVPGPGESVALGIVAALPLAALL